MAKRGVDTVLFDLDGTICTYRRPGEEVLAIAFDAVGVEPFFTEAAYQAKIGTLQEWKDSYDEYRAECFASLANDAGVDESLGRAVAAAYAEERDQRDVRFLDGADEALETLVNHYPLALVTNGGPDIQRPKLESLGIEDIFETIVFAGYDTPAKPDPEPFHRALGAVNSVASQAVYIGNSLAHDVAGARAAGLRSVWIDNGTDPDPTPDHIIASPADLATPPWEV